MNKNSLNKLILGLKKIKYRFKSYVNYLINKMIRIILPFRLYKSVTIIPHEGLGDLISILPALQAIHNKGVHITLTTDLAKWSQVKNAFINVPDIDVIQMASNLNYTIPPNILKSRRSDVVPLGFFSNFSFIKDYPYSFYWQLGVDRKVMSNFLYLKSGHYDFLLPEYFDFIDLETSKGMIGSDYSLFSQNKVISLNNTEIIIDKAGSELHLALDPSVSFHQKVYIALRSQVIICSDAALFNAVIRLPTHPKIIVHTRKHFHTHSTEIYGNCKFDGGIYEFPARNA